MYSALIVDDEKLIRLGMRKAIPWNSIGIGEVYVAQSGREALDVIRENKPEILITDIKMDEMTGLDLIDQAKHFVPEIKVIVLTGYDEFEYARQCIKLKVHDFFLKPIDENALVESLKKQTAALEAGKIKKLADINENRARAVTEQMQIENFLRNLVCSGRNQQDGEIEKFCRQYNYHPEQYVQAAIIVPALYEDSDNDVENFTALTIKNICIGMVDAQNRGLTFMDNCGRIVIAFFLSGRKSGILDRKSAV
jgi:two-component system response regulator YesN